MAEEPNVAIWQRTFLKGALYYDNRRGSIECVVREISANGARLTFDHPVNVPDNIELFIPNKQQTLRGRVSHRATNEIFISFEIDHTLDPRCASDAELQRRVETLEAEIAALKRLVAKVKAKVLPQDLDVA